jgi:FG-GAP-like repeat
MGRGHTCLLLGAVVAAGFLLAPAHAPAGAYPLMFAPAQELAPTNLYPEAVAIGDVTGDRRKDVVMSTGAWESPQYDWKVLLYRQLPNGTLAPPEVFSPIWKVAVHGLAVGDVDGDHRADVAVATELGVNVFRQRRGTLARPFFVPGTVGGYAVDIADLTRDGRNDLVVRGGTWVRIAKRVRGGFRTRIATRSRAQDVEAGDVTGDRIPDLVTAGWNGRLRIYRQRRNGRFRRARAPRTLRGASGVEVSDLNRDGRPDIAVANGRFVELLLQKRRGKFAGPLVAPGVDYPGAIEALDMSGDGRSDLIARSSESVGVVLQHGRGTLEGFDLYHAYRPLSRHPNAIAAGDFTGDGRPDIAAAGGLGRGLFVFRQLPRPARPEPPTPPRGGPPPPPPPPTPGPLRFEPVRSYPLDRNPISLAIGDFSGDNRSDVLVGTGGDYQTDGRLYGFLQEGGSLRAPFWFGADAGGRVDGIAIGDVDGDGDGDAAVSGWPGIGLYEQRDGRLSAEPWLVPGTWGASRVRIVDFDGNRRKDLLFARRGMEPGGLFVAKNRGGWFAVSRVLKDSTFVDFADVTGDKRPDVVTSFGSTGTVVVYRRLPKGGFAGPRTYTLTYPFQSAAGVGDVTGDGRNDVVLTTSESWPGAHLLVMAQNGSGTLNPPVSQPAVQDPGADRARHES